MAYILSEKVFKELIKLLATVVRALSNHHCTNYSI